MSIIEKIKNFLRSLFSSKKKNRKQARVKMPSNLSRIARIPNKNYKPSGIKSYVYALRKCKLRRRMFENIEERLRLMHYR